jgi:hypothetical protein
VLRRLEAGCAAPVGITAVVSGDDVSLVAEVYALDGTRVRVERTFARAAVAGSDGRKDAAEAVVRELLDAGAGDLADLAGVDDDRECTVETSAPSGGLRGARVLVPRGGAGRARRDSDHRARRRPDRRAADLVGSAARRGRARSGVRRAGGG